PSFHSDVHHSLLCSFPTRRSSDLAVVADGMGGHQAGEIASDLAVKTVRENYELTTEFTKISDSEKWIKTMIEKMNEDVYQFATGDRKSTRLNSSHVSISYAVFCLK